MIDFQQIATLRRFEPSQRFPDYFNSTTYVYFSEPFFGENLFFNCATKGVISFSSIL